MANLSPEALKIVKKMQQNELNESIIYAEISKFAKGEENKETLLRLANEEKAHYEIWKKYTNIEMKPQKINKTNVNTKNIILDLNGKTITGNCANAAPIERHIDKDALSSGTSVITFAIDPYGTLTTVYAVSHTK